MFCENVGEFSGFVKAGNTLTDLLLLAAKGTPCTTMLASAPQVIFRRMG
jgi:hypothetical protein